ncbi:MAG TPA: GntR family transcriptional regulator [Candidatus Saccharimonadales bacterium]|nr:GntR family transcriptional regulator [Candidatus Saccharimonadales bacterium]
MIILRLNTHSGVPPYLQIVQQIKHDIRMGLLKEGDKLPSVKEAVTMTAVNPNTVFKAYRELEGQGFVKGQAGSGVFVLQQYTAPSANVQAKLATTLTDWLNTAQSAGLDEEAIEALFTITLRNMKKG